ncbi:MAG: hypothetical protein KF895_03170 [Parvibaculum sp.]|nr:hypothetical protein [Parvibaculum sp.]
MTTPPAELIFAFLAGCFVGPGILIAAVSLKSWLEDKREARLDAEREG